MTQLKAMTEPQPTFTLYRLGIIQKYARQ